MTSQERIDARRSVEALLGDLRHIISSVPDTEWIETSRAVLRHHDPPIDVGLLDPDVAELQARCRDVLVGIAERDEAAARSAAKDVRRLETALGQES